MGMLGVTEHGDLSERGLREGVGGVAVFAVDEGFGLGVAIGGDGAGPDARSGDGRALEGKTTSQAAC